MRQLAADPRRHLILVTATPHSGKEQGFRNLVGLLDPDLATVDLDTVRGRQRLARHFVQRRRGDIRHYLDEDTEFPSDRHTKDAPYGLSARATPRCSTGCWPTPAGRVAECHRRRRAAAVRQRVRWWSALALLRALASSPPAAAATLRTRAATAGAASVDEADQLGRAAVLDTGDTDTLEGIDTTPGADTLGVGDPGDGDAQTAVSRRLGPGRSLSAVGCSTWPRPLGPLVRAGARPGVALVGGRGERRCWPTGTTRSSSAGSSPRPTTSPNTWAEALGASATVAAVTGELPPAVREERIAELSARDGRHLLVATDCLSEGVNLQDAFQAVVHYDLAWNPTRHEQREGRVDRFGQRRDVVRAVTIDGQDNGIDRIVLDVLIRKFKAIRDATGVSVPGPDEADQVVEALVEGLIRRRDRADQLAAELGRDAGARTGFTASGNRRPSGNAPRRQNTPRSRFTPKRRGPRGPRRPQLPSAAGPRWPDFVAAALPRPRARRSTPAAPPAQWRADTSPPCPLGLLGPRSPPDWRKPLVFHPDLPRPPGATPCSTAPTPPWQPWPATSSTPPSTRRLGTRVAARVSVARTNAVGRRTTLAAVALPVPRRPARPRRPPPAGVRGGPPDRLRRMRPSSPSGSTTRPPPKPSSTPRPAEQRRPRPTPRRSIQTVWRAAADGWLELVWGPSPTTWPTSCSTPTAGSGHRPAPPGGGWSSPPKNRSTCWASTSSFPSP